MNDWRARAERCVWPAIVVCLVLLHVFHNALGIADKEVWLDEASTWGVAHRSFLTNLTLPTEFHSQPPLQYLLLHMLMYISTSATFLRLMTAWIPMLAAILFVLLGLPELSKPARVLAALTIAGYSDFVNYLSRELRPYALGSVSTFIATILLVRFLREPTSRNGRLYFVAATIMLYALAWDVWTALAHGLYVFVVIAPRLRHGLRPWWRQNRNIIIAFTALAIAYLPYTYLAIHYQLNPQTDPQGAITDALNYEHYRVFLIQKMPLHWQFIWFLGAFAVWEDFRKGSLEPLLWFLVVVGQIFFVNWFFHGRWIMGPAERYLAPALLPYIYFMLGRGFTVLTRRVPRSAAVAALAVLIVTAVDHWAPFRDSWNAPVSSPRWRTITTQISAIPGRKVIFLDCGFEGQIPEYYARRDPSQVFALEATSGWGAGGKDQIDPDYIRKTVAEEKGRARCFFYSVGGGGSPYYSTLEPLMKSMGWIAEKPIDTVHGFCRP